MSLLFVTWDGPGNNYLETAFVPVFARLGRRLSVLQFTYAPKEELAVTRAVMDKLGVDYRAVRVPHFRPLSLSTSLAVAWGVPILARELRRVRAEAVLVRSAIPAMIALGARRWLGDTRLVYEADGIVQDERVDFAGWSSSGPLYRVMREAEAQLLCRADRVITRTERCRSLLLSRAGAGVDPSRFFTVPNGKDEREFKPDPAARAAVRAELGVAPEAPLIAYCGSLGAQYRPERMLGFYKAVQAARPDARFVLMSGHEDKARALAAEAPGILGFRAHPEAVPRYLAAADLGLALRAPSYSQRCVAPIKLAEYLLVGLPVLSNPGVGDTEAMLTGQACAHLLPSEGDGGLDAAARWFLSSLDKPGLRDEARALGLLEFSLTEVSARYRAALGVAE